jgi:hypothetical protein
MSRIIGEAALRAPDVANVCIFVLLRFKAFILSICVLIYLVEFAAVPRTRAACSPERAANGDCCHQGKEQCPKPLKGCNAGADCCLNCPLCFVMLLPVSADRAAAIAGAREYGVWHTAYLYHYHASCWKPPNQA